MQGISLADDISLESGSALIKKPFKATKKSLMSFKNYAIRKRGSDGGVSSSDDDIEVDAEVPKKIKKKQKQNRQATAESEIKQV